MSENDWFGGKQEVEVSGKQGYVVHCAKEKYDIYCGRPSQWGNPFEIGKDGTREEVLEKYEKWAIEQGIPQKAKEQLKGKVLGCWCAPRKCHCDLLAKWAND